MANIKATKGGRVKAFTQLQWANMPADKYGWSPVGGVDVEAPAEVKKIAEEPKKVSISTPPEVLKTPEKIPVNNTEATQTTEPAPKAKAKAKGKKTVK